MSVQARLDGVRTDTRDCVLGESYARYSSRQVVAAMGGARGTYSAAASSFEDESVAEESLSVSVSDDSPEVVSSLSAVVDGDS